MSGPRSKGPRPDPGRPGLHELIAQVAFFFLLSFFFLNLLLASMKMWGYCYTRHIGAI